MNKMNKKNLIGCIILVFFLTIGIPLLINMSYNLPLTIIQTEWKGNDILEFYGTLLGIGATVATFLIGVYMTIEQIRYQQNYQQTMKLWQETEDTVNQCLEMIHPKKLKYAAIDVVIKNESANALSLLSHVENYRINVIVSVDKLSASLTKVHSVRLEQIVEEIQEIRNELVPISESYLGAFWEVRRCKAKYTEDSEKINEQKQCFQQQIKQLENRLDVIYQEKYLDIAKNKASLFRDKYGEIAQQKPKFRLCGDTKGG